MRNCYKIWQNMILYKNHSLRLQKQDYGANGYYFITICTQNKTNFFGEIVPTAGSDHDPTIVEHYMDVIWSDYNPTLRPSPIGHIAREYWEQIPQHFSFVELDAFVVMPNHIHGILYFNNPNKPIWEPNTFTSPSQNLGSVIRQYKGSVKRYANKNEIPFQWQTGYYEKVIRDTIELPRIINYIQNNPIKWIEKGLKR